MTYGDVTLTVDLSSRSNDFDPATAVVKILDQEILLRDANVIMIDGVDSSTPSFVGARYVEPRFTGKDAVAAIVKCCSSSCDAILFCPMRISRQ